MLSVVLVVSSSGRLRGWRTVRTAVECVRNIARGRMGGVAIVNPLHHGTGLDRQRGLGEGVVGHADSFDRSRGRWGWGWGRIVAGAVAAGARAATARRDDRRCDAGVEAHVGVLLFGVREGILYR